MIWRISESEGFFSESLAKEEFPIDEGMRIRHPQKRLQWLASRHLLTLAHPEPIVRRLSAKPTLTNGPELSFSHSGDYAALLISDHHSGIDIQTYNEKLFRIAPKFSNDGEAGLISAPDELAALTLSWSIKEAIFKYYTTQLPFKFIQILAHDPVKNTAEVEVVRGGKRQHHRLHADFLDSLSLAYVLE
jgi:phosphopantetheinyl transferase